MYSPIEIQAACVWICEQW